MPGIGAFTNAVAVIATNEDRVTLVVKSADYTHVIGHDRDGANCHVYVWKAKKTDGPLIACTVEPSSRQDDRVEKPGAPDASPAGRIGAEIRTGDGDETVAFGACPHGLDVYTCALCRR